MQSRREQLSAKLLQTSSSSMASESTRFTSYRNRSAIPIDASQFNPFGTTARTKSNIALVSNVVIDSQQNAINAKILQESNRFLDDILTSRKKSADALAVQNSTVQPTVISRTSEEKALYPDKLILDR